MQPKPDLAGARVLYVCFADSSHSQEWMGLLQGSGAQVRAFAYDLGGGASSYPALEWPSFTYTLKRPMGRAGLKPGQGIQWRLPNLPGLRGIEGGLVAGLDLETKYLRRVIATWKPHIVHSLSLLPSGERTWRALSGLPRAQRPRWVASSWGSDINLLRHDEEHRRSLQTVLRECDGFIADCRRDIRQAIELGLPESRVALHDAIPVTGGIAPAEVLPEAETSPEALRQRRLILVPKAYEGIANKVLPVLEALRLAEASLGEYEIHFLMGARDIRMWFEQLPESVRRRSHWHASVPKEELQRMMRQARVVVAPSISDGSPSTLLEAMASSALPLVSPLASIQEWVEDGRNGLLAHALYPEQIAAALRRALEDDDLVHRAALANRQIILERSNRDTIRSQVLGYYRSLLPA